MKIFFNRNYYNDKQKKGDIAFKFSFSLMFCINEYFHSARNQSIS